MTPWRFAIPTAILLAAFIVLTYLLFSPLGLAGEMDQEFWIAVTGTVCATALLWTWSEKRWRSKHATNSYKH